VTTILGKPCLITVTHEPKDGGGVYANVGAVAKLPNGIPAPTLEGEAILYDADNLGTFEKLRPWLQDAIKAQIIQREDSLPEQRGDPRGQAGHIPGYRRRSRRRRAVLRCWKPDPWAHQAKV
jgi:hypothetical protein